jgi:hypothetical protein
VVDPKEAERIQYAKIRSRYDRNKLVESFCTDRDDEVFYVYAYVYIHVYMCMCIYMYVYMYIYVCIDIYKYMYINI